MNNHTTLEKSLNTLMNCQIELSKKFMNVSAKISEDLLPDLIRNNE